MSPRKNIQLFITAYFILLTSYSFSQEFRNSGFVKPMNLPFNLSGSFGEPRPDHFHSGIDIKTNGIEGESVFAIGAGYISRIRVSPFGYGRAIYITHTNGFTSVYGHLSKFNAVIEKYIHAQHYAQKKSELDLYFDAAKFPVKQNDTIAFSGNTGGSSAPHLHFEIRDSKTEHALNPLDFYAKDFYADTIAPQLNQIKINTIYNGIYGCNTEIYPLKKINDGYVAQDSIIIRNDSIINFSFEGFDKQDSSENKNGIKKIEVFQENNLVFKYDLTDIDFDKTRMCNVFVDYHEMKNDSGYFYTAYQLKNNALNIYEVHKDYYILKNGENIFKIFCYDYKNNKTTINLYIYRRNTEIVYDSATVAFKNIVFRSVNASIKDSIKSADFKMKFSALTFYDDIDLELEKSENNNKIAVSEKYNIHCNNRQFIPLQKPALIDLKSSIKKNRNKIVFVRQNHKGKETALKTNFDKNKFYAETKELGTFYLKYDTTNPKVEILNLKSEVSNQNIQTKIIDELSGIDTYNGYIDNKWVNFYYDAKNDVIQYNFDEYCSKGEHLIKIIVTDKVGNKTIVQQKFIY